MPRKQIEKMGNKKPALMISTTPNGRHLKIIISTNKDQMDSPLYRLDMQMEVY